jgi:Leucine-rich repeat (LRR) protein
MTSAGVPWGSFASLRSLTHLDLSDNPIAILPSTGAAKVFQFQCESLQTLSLARCQLSGLVPSCFLQSLQNLRHVSFAGNALEAIPDDLSANTSLEVVDFSHNGRIRCIPKSMGALRSLVSLDVSHNAIDTDGVPTELFKQATSLVEIALHANPIRIEALREIDGWNEFDSRRQSRANKALSSRVMLGNSVFDEGANNERHERY